MNVETASSAEKVQLSVSTRKLPVNFDEDDLSIFEHELIKELPPLEVVEMKDIKASSDGLLFQRNRIMIESFAFPANFEKWKKRSVVKAYVESLLLRRGRRFDQPVVWVTDDWSNGYFHWLCDVLPRVIIASDKLQTATLLLPPEFQNSGYVTTSLEALGISRIEYLRPNEVATCSQMFLPKHTAASGDFNEPVIEKLREKFRKQFNSDLVDSNGRIYISREKAAKRRVVNEDNVRDVLREYDFEIVHAEDLTFHEQVRKFGSARFVVAAHGAGLTNMLFMPDNSRMLEFRKVGDNVNNCYFNMSSALGIGYYYQLCTSPGNEDAHLADLYVDTGKLRENVELMLEEA